MIQLFNPLPQLTVIEGFALDVNLEDSIMLKNRLPRYATELGYDLGAFSGQELARYKISGISTRTPIQPFKAYYDKIYSDWVNSGGTNPDTVGSKIFLSANNILEFTFQWLCEQGGFTVGDNINNLYATKKPKPLTITTKYTTLYRMFIEDLTFPRDRNSGEAIKFDINFVQIPEITNQSVFLRNAGETSEGTENVESKAKEQVTSNSGEKTDEKSQLLKTSESVEDLELKPKTEKWVDRLYGKLK